jgi:hypothetical protein
VLVLSQACDLVQSKTRQVVVSRVHPARFLVDRGEIKAQTVRDQVRLGKVFGWYYLSDANPTIPLEESIVDLRDIHTVSRVLLEQLVATGKRIGRIVTPYREHLAQHFAVTYMRIALPDSYETKSS